MTVQEFTLNIQQENGDYQEVKVSEDYMDLCYASAQHIVNQIGDVSYEEFIELIKNSTSDHNMRTVIGRMVKDLMEIRVINSIMERVLGF